MADRPTPKPQGHGHSHGHASASGSGSGSNPPKIRRRNRIISSCLECRRRKLKCNKQNPCENCVRFSRECVFLAPALDSESQDRLNEFKERIDSLEQVLERGPSSRLDVVDETYSTRRASTYDDDQSLVVPEDERNLEPSPLGIEDSTYDDDADDMMDVGVQLGRLRITDRIGGYVRPRMAVELLEDLRINQPSGFPVVVDDLASGESFSAQNLPTWLSPSAEYISPDLNHLFASPSSLQDHALANFLPTKQLADELMQIYWQACHPIACIVHRPSFERQYDGFWKSVLARYEPPNPIQALVFAALLTASVSLTPEYAQATFNLSKSRMVDNFRAGCESALARANVLRTTRTDTLQAFVMYLIPLCRGEISRLQAALTSSAIRLAECAGLNRDGLYYGLSPTATHVRRLIWHQLCWLDIRTCEAVGPRPQIRMGDFDTKFPLHVPEDELDGFVSPVNDVTDFLPNTLSRIRFEIVELQRELWFDRRRVEAKTLSLTAILAKIEGLRERIERRYLSKINTNIPLHAYTARVARLLIYKLRVFMLNNYIVPGARGIPDRLRQVVLTSGTELLENAIALETVNEFSPWLWYSTAYQQYHTSTLLMLEIYAYPMRREADRIWTCLDYIFDIPPQMDRPEKARMILTEWRKRMEIYHSIRKHRAPTSIDQRISGAARQISLQRQGDRIYPVTSQASESGPRKSVSPIKQAINMTAYAMPSDSTGTSFAAAPNAGYGSSNDSTYPQFQDSQPFGGGATMTGLLSTYSSPSVNNSLRASPLMGVNSGDLMAEIDWSEWDRLFPPEYNTGDLNLPSPQASQNSSSNSHNNNTIRSNADIPILSSSADSSQQQQNLVFNQAHQSQSPQDQSRHSIPANLNMPVTNINDKPLANSGFAATLVDNDFVAEMAERQRLQDLEVMDADPQVSGRQSVNRGEVVANYAGNHGADVEFDLPLITYFAVPPPNRSRTSHAARRNPGGGNSEF